MTEEGCYEEDASQERRSKSLALAERLREKGRLRGSGPKLKSY